MIVLGFPERIHLSRRPSCVFAIPRPNAEEQRALWFRALGDEGKSTTSAAQAYAMDRAQTVDRLVAHFDLLPSAIASAADQALAEQGPPGTMADRLWTACRLQARSRLDDLAQRVEPVATWDDLVLPEPAMTALRDAAAQVRHRTTVHERWGFASKSRRGLGISALLVGESGTGKTMAAEVLAGALQLDLYFIDLSRVVSKYIGETEKNLGRVFDAAEAGGAVLLFDEADALFGKRSEVRDSHDRYANIEVSYLLQRMESYRGLACLTTNLKSAMDVAFLRRIRFIVNFPFPDAEQRARIWERIFPKETPREGLEIDKLAQLNLAGGNIRNVALQAAFLAAEAGEPVRMHHLLAAARREYAKLEKPMTDREIRGWA
jgi:SpoVK/Ycf46/Vps4 family AAA+-type ATPase